MLLWPTIGMLGLVAYACMTVRIVLTWHRRSRKDVTIWFVVLTIVGGLSIGLLFVR